MGWTFLGTDKKDLIIYLQNSYQGCRTIKLLKSKVVGNNVWHQLKHIDTEKVYIAVDLLAPDDHGTHWGYKSLTEFDGPCAYNCPIGFLKDLSPTTGYAVDWRLQVMAEADHKKQETSNYSGLKAGQNISYDNKTYTLFGDLGRKGWSVFDEKGQLLKMSYSQVKKAVATS